MALKFRLSWLILLQVFSRLTHECSGLKLSKSTALLVFGNSAVDTGSNNYIPTIPRSKYDPYGINFTRHIPTGRYSDEKLLPDISCPHKASKMLFLLLCGETYPMMNCFRVSSAAAGFDDQTKSVTNAIPTSKQPRFLRDYLPKLEWIVGKKVLKELFGKL
nr:GDSL esterase/lipase At1g58430-like [Coffea arabica]